LLPGRHLGPQPLRLAGDLDGRATGGCLDPVLDRGEALLGTIFRAAAGGGDDRNTFEFAHDNLEDTASMRGVKPMRHSSAFRAPAPSFHPGSPCSADRAT